MADLIERARAFATRAHQRIDQRRKYSGQPYDVHLRAVADLVASVSEDPETVAAAWLHDVVEDTAVTLDDLQREFGPGVQSLVEQLTDVSRPSHGNRAARKEVDRQHTSRASPRAKTVKLADLIDNCQDITRHDPRFARVFLQEMEALLAVLGEGDERLLQRARSLHADCLRRLRPAATAPGPIDDGLQTLMPELAGARIVRVFRESFTAGDIFDHLVSFDADRAEAEIAGKMTAQRLGIAGLRVDGAVRGWVRLADLQPDSNAPCEQRMQPISASQTLPSRAPLFDVVGVLTRHDCCFVSAADAVIGVIPREAVNHPLVRMWLFGALTLYEMGLVRLIRSHFPADAWQAVLTPSRLEKARELQQERLRRNRHSELIDCLQFADKVQLVQAHPSIMATLGLSSKRVGKQIVKDLESLRNHLVHAQDIVAHDWVQVIRITQRLGELDPR